MNVFYLSTDPRESAEWMVDRHVIKMILESAQMLSTAHRVLDGLEVVVTLEKEGKRRNKKVWVLGDSRNDIFYSATHINHPCSIWARKSVENYSWLVDHMFALGDEYTYRYGKKHATIEKLGYYLQSPPLALKEWDFTTPPCAMPEEYLVSDNPVDNYRNYYKLAKSNLHSWKNRPAPDWIS